MVGWSVTSWADTRIDLSVRRALDSAGAVYTDAIRIEQGPSAYSSMAELPSGTIGVLYERGAPGISPVSNRIVSERARLLKPSGAL